MKIPIELNLPDERMFLNFWNWKNGDDVICEIIDDKLMLSKHDENGDDLPPIEISFIEFCNLVKIRAKELI